MGRFYSRRLSNGLVVGFYQKRSPFFAVTIAARAGFRFESQELAGIGRVCLDSLFEGSRHFPSAYLMAHALDSLTVGPVQVQASAELLEVSALTEESTWRELLRPLLDAAFHPQFHQVRAHSGRYLEGHAHRKPKFGIVDDPELQRLAELTSHHLLGPSAGQSFFQPDFSSIANEENQSEVRWSREDLLKFHSEFFAPDNSVVILAGDAEFEEVFREVEKWVGALKNPEPQITNEGDGDSVPHRFRESLKEVGEEHRPPSGVRTPHLESFDRQNGSLWNGGAFPVGLDPTLGLCWGIFSSSDRDLEFQALYRVLAGSQSARIPHRLYQAHSLANSFYAELNRWSGFSWMSFSLRVPENRVRLVCSEMISEFHRLMNDSLDLHPEELPRVLGAWVREEHAIYESVLFVSRRFAESLLVFGRMPLSLEETQARIFNLKAQDVLSAAQSFLTPGWRAVLIQGQVPRADQFAVESLIRKGHE